MDGRISLTLKFSAVLAGMVLFGAALAQKATPPKKETPPPKAGPKTPAKKPQPRPQPSPGVEETAPEYKLQREDIIRIQILDRDQADVNQEVQVGRDGRITPPFLKPKIVEGMSLTQLKNELTQEYETELEVQNVKVSVVLIKVRDLRAAVVGAVRSPGSFIIRPGDTVLNLLSLSGDSLEETRADLRRATLTRAKSREIVPIDVVALRSGDLSQNYEISDGDILNIPLEQGLNRVLVWGKVRTPGSIPFVDGMLLMDALTAAGGDIPNQSKFSKVQVLREIQGAPGSYQRITCNIVDYVRKGDFRQNIKLQRRDVIVVPDTGNPNFDQFNQIVSLIFVLERFGINIFKF